MPDGGGESADHERCGDRVIVPAGIGVQEGVFLLLCGLLTGSPEVGVAVALIRRAREIAWLLWGGLIAAVYALDQPKGR